MDQSGVENAAEVNVTVQINYGLLDPIGQKS